MALTDPRLGLRSILPSRGRRARSRRARRSSASTRRPASTNVWRILAGFAEIVVVNSGSSDGTLAIVDRFARRGFPIRLIHQPWLGYARQKQLALELATQPWVLSIDADEWLTRISGPRCRASWRPISVAGWKVRRSLTLYGRSKPVSRWTRPEHILRLVRRGRARFDPALIVHEGLVADHGDTPSRATACSGTSAACR